jgi:hypothetical protein
MGNDMKFVGKAIDLWYLGRQWTEDSMWDSLKHAERWADNGVSAIMNVSGGLWLQLDATQRNWRFVTITIVNIIGHSVLYLKQNVSETGFFQMN